MAGALETIAYGVARGCTRAYLDVLEERKHGLEEVPNAEDRARADRIAAAVQRVLRSQQQGSTP
jgi:hypothetical protein